MTDQQGVTRFLVYADHAASADTYEHDELQMIATALKNLPMVVQVDVLGIPVP